MSRRWTKQTVTLRGRVEDAALRTRAESLAGGVPDVVRVLNQIQATPGAAPRSSTERTLGESLDERTLQMQVKLALSLNRELQGSDLDDLEALLNNLEKNIGTYDETRRRSVYARLLALAEKIGVGLAHQRQLLNTAIGSQPKNDPTGGLTKTVTDSQKARQAELNRLDGRLRELRARIAALNPDKKAGVGPRGGGAGGPGGTTVTPSAGDRKK